MAKRRKPKPAESAPPTSVPSMPAWKAFVVQFSRETSSGSGVFAGRVEHLSSGRRARFESREGLPTVLSRILESTTEPRGDL